MGSLHSDTSRQYHFLSSQLSSTIKMVFVVGAGLPRTGTNSTKVALEILLKGPVYHMYEVIFSGNRDIDFWNELCKNPKTSEEWQKFYGNNGYKGAVDYPSVLFYKEIAEAFPDSKVVLTVRDPEAWYKSVTETIKELNDDAISFPVNILNYLKGQYPLDNMIQNVLRRKGNRLGEGVFDVMDEGLEASIKYYNDWVEKVKEAIPADRLLVFSVKDGWEPLCKFLDLPVPEEPFPHVNDKNVIKQMTKGAKTQAWSLVLGVPVLLGLSSYIAKNFWFDM